jgi:hypothetical protein
VGGEALAHGEEAFGGDTDEDGDKRYSPGGVDVGSLQKMLHFVSRSKGDQK